MENKTVYKVEEVMKILGVGKNTIYDMVNDKVFPVIRRKRTIIIPKHAFDKWFASFSENDDIENNNYSNINVNNVNLESLKNHILLIDNMIANLKLIKSDLEKLK